MEKLGDRITAMRKYLGKTAKELAVLAEIDPQTLSRIETGVVEDPGFQTMVRISHTLGVSLEYFSLTKAPDAKTFLDYQKLKSINYKLSKLPAEEQGTIARFIQLSFTDNFERLSKLETHNPDFIFH